MDVISSIFKIAKKNEIITAQTAPIIKDRKKYVQNFSMVNIAISSTSASSLVLMIILIPSTDVANAIATALFKVLSPNKII